MGKEQGGRAQPIPLALYIHLPWCLSKCPYCDFNSYRIRDDGVPERAYVNALLADLEQDLPLVQGRSITSVFLGGGTPSLLSAEAIHRLLENLRSRLEFAAGLEITLEANPGTVNWEKLRDYRAAGVNRLSIGVQSFDAELLKRLGRAHGPKQARLAAEAAHRAGFDNFNLDMMVGLPGQEPGQALADITEAISLAPSHISYYQLTLEPNTRFYRDPPPLPDDEAAWSMQCDGRNLLIEKSYLHYEISAFARAGLHCRHNLNYWTFGDYLGIGAGAHGKLSDNESGIIRRRWKKRNPTHYMAVAGSPACIDGDQVLQEYELPLEFMLNAMRLNDGVAVGLFNARTGLPLQVMRPALDRAGHRGLLEITEEWMRPTPLGRQFLNELLEFFVFEQHASDPCHG